MALRVLGRGRSPTPVYPSAARALARSLTLSDFNCPQAARISRPRGVLTGLAYPARFTTSANRFRVTVSVFNDMGDIDRLLAAIGKA